MDYLMAPQLTHCMFYTQFHLSYAGYYLNIFVPSNSYVDWDYSFPFSIENQNLITIQLLDKKKKLKENL